MLIALNKMCLILMLIIVIIIANYYLYYNCYNYAPSFLSSTLVLCYIV